jgi:hypothetical protein
MPLSVISKLLTGVSRMYTWIITSLVSSAAGLLIPQVAGVKWKRCSIMHGPLLLLIVVLSVMTPPLEAYPLDDKRSSANKANPKKTSIVPLDGLVSLPWKLV